MKYLLTILLCAFIAFSFNGRKCEHVFVEVEQAAIKIEQPSVFLGGAVYRPYCWPTGLQEGKELICVKCFHKQKQILDYGKPEPTGPTLGSLILSQSSPINAGPCYDSIFTKSAGGWLKVDSCFIIHSK